jgi:hypothetical protein
MYAAGFFEILVLVLFPGLWGLPIGMPPGPEDPLVSKMAPEQCLFYTNWAPRAAPDANSKNSTEQLLAEPDVQRAVGVLFREIQRAIDRQALESREPVATVMAQLAPKAVEWLFTETGAVAVSNVGMGPAGPDIRASLLVRLGEKGRDIPALLRQLQNLAPPGLVTTKRVGNVECFQIQVVPESPVLLWGVHEGYLVAGIGDGELAEMLKRLQTPPPAWLTELQQQMTLPRRATLAYLDLQRARDIASEIGGPEVATIIESLGLSNVERYAAVTGLDESGFVARTVIKINGKPQGVLAWCNAAPLTRGDLKGIPADSYVALAMRFDLAAFYDEFMEVMTQIDPRAAIEMREGMRGMEDFFQLRIRDDVLQGVGDVWYLYTAPSSGGLLTGWTAVARVRDRQKLQRVNSLLIAMMGAAGEFGPQVRRMTSNGKDIFYLSVPQEMPLAPAWCIAEDELIFGLYPQTVISHLINRSKPSSLVDSPAFAPIWSNEQGPLSLSYVDMRALVEMAYPFAQMGLSVAFEELRREGINLDVTVLPAAASLTPHFRPAVSSMRKTPDGLEFEQRQSVPGGSIGSSLPVGVALILPAVQAARGSAARMQSSNNLKQILLAMHNYHDVYRQFPATYAMDKDGTPLLSWRVHLLPFVEQQQLYDQLHLDEPWDSEHNKQFINQIPEVFRSPRSTAGPGMTTYLAPRGPRTAFPPTPDEEKGKGRQTRGMRLANITDGTSNTIGVVEVNDEHAVIWTKPDDYEYDPADPLAGLLGTWPGGFLAAFCDGSVQFINENLDPTALLSMFTRDGGEVVNRDF